MGVGKVAAAFGKGMFAGAIGTAAMTASSTIEMKLQGRQASNAPGQAAAKMLGLQFADEDSQTRFSGLVHWGYGIGWGGVRGMIAATGLSWKKATMTHAGVVWGTEQVMLPALGIAPPIIQWDGKTIFIDTLHHLVQVGTTGIAYAWLDR